jgi:polyisoprenoid-binding protein YceI
MSTAVATGISAGTWTVDPSHANVGFVARHLMVQKVRGLFAGVAGAIHVGETLDDTWVEATIDAASLSTRDDQRDGHLKSPDFLDVENYPEIRFRSTAIEDLGNGRFRVTGALTIRDVTRPSCSRRLSKGLLPTRTEAREPRSRRRRRSTARPGG